MATGKKKIIVYADWKPTFDALTDEEAGKLIKHFFAYVNDENPQTNDRIVALMFEPIKATLKRDLKKWEQIQERNKENGQKGGRPKNQKNPVGYSGIEKNPKKGDSDSVSDNVIYTIPSKEEFIAYGVSKLEDVSVEALGLKYEAWLSSNWCTTKNGKEVKIKNWKTTLNNTLTYLPKQPKQQKTVEQLTYENVMKQMEANR